ncbi:MAG: class I tRNA ligase family protein [Ilumatobacteraceae bacterium]
MLAADFVSTEDGTGVVHMAPGFGEEDQNVATPSASRRSARWTSTGAAPARSRLGDVHVFDANPMVTKS